MSDCLVDSVDVSRIPMVSAVLIRPATRCAFSAFWKFLKISFLGTSLWGCWLTPLLLRLLLSSRTHLLLKIAKSFLERANLGKIAAFPGTLITPRYFDEFLGEMSRVMSSRGEPFTLSKLSKSC